MHSVDSGNCFFGSKCILAGFMSGAYVKRCFIRGESTRARLKNQGRTMS